METNDLDSVTEYFKHLGKITQEIDREELARLWKLVKKRRRGRSCRKTEYDP